MNYEELREIVERAAYYTLPCITEEFHLDMFTKALLASGVTVQRWIPVKERLPEHKTKVIVCDKENEKVTISYFLYIMAGVPSFCIYDEDWSFSDNNVTHWMPLPDAPKDGE